MIHPDKLFGRLGNRMFQMAALYAVAKEKEVDIYFQDPKHFEEYSEEIKKLFSDGIKPVDKVAIHVRRGDYVDNPFYVDLTKTDYYEKAIEYFPGQKFLVFSDDIAFCKAYFSNRDDIEFCEETDTVKSMNIMAGCKGHIIANSSFSWWAAYLGQGTVVAPKKWYADGIERTVCPPEWIRI